MKSRKWKHRHVFYTGIRDGKLYKFCMCGVSTQERKEKE